MKVRKVNYINMRKKKVIVILIILISIIALVSYVTVRTKTQMKELFKMNKELQEEGYYMAEFEFKMLGIAYDLDKGHYYTSLARINQLHKQLKTKKDLIKIPKFKSKEEELQFYLNLQNPNTGAFMDESYPFCTYTGPTGNVLEHIDSLSTELGQPVKLKYPLKYLDEINTQEKMKTYLDDVATVGWLVAKLPQTSFHFSRDMLSLFYEESIVEKYKLYNMPSETKETLLKWFYDIQDSKTGLWGPKSKSGKLMKKDVMNTVSIMKVFVDEEGKNIYKDFPLRYKDELSKSILEEVSKPIPKDDELEEWHEWNLEMSKSTKAILKYLWRDVSKESKEKIKSFLENYITLKFEKFYVPKDGAFSYYPYGEHATIDGTGEYFIFEKIGALSPEKQEYLWGSPKENIVDLGTYKISNFKSSDLDTLVKEKSINSLRFYKNNTDYKNLSSYVLAVVYPRETKVLDIMDLTPKVKHWINTTDQTMGNWTSKATIKNELDNINFEEVPVYDKKDTSIEKIEKDLKDNGKLTVVGFDILQIPRYKIVFEYKK
jgi:hypothetical protein